MLPEFHLCAGEWMGDTQDQVAAYIEDRGTSTLSMVWGVLHVPALWVTIGWFMGDWREIVRRYRVLEEEERHNEEEKAWVDLAGVREGVREDEEY